MNDSLPVATDVKELKAGFFPAPEDPARWPAWREELKNRTDALRAFADPQPRDRAAQAWAARAYAMGFVMLWDHELIDHETGGWKVEALLDRMDREFGGVDVVVLWNNYPLSGVDDRHQLAYFDELPGGRAGLAEAVRRFHARSVRVMVAHKPWLKTVPDGWDSVEAALVDLVWDCGLDGIYLDCSAGPAAHFRQRLAAVAGADKIFVSEAPATPEGIGTEAGCWQQMTDDSAVPGVYRNRLLDREMMVYESRRYFHDPVRELQRGWMNGGGQVIWENVFGYWAAYSPRCKSWMRLLFPAQRRFADFFVQGSWTPHVGGGVPGGVYVSKWEWEGRSLWTAVNRRGHDLEKTLFRLEGQPGCRYLDVISGQEYRATPEADGRVALAGFFLRDGLAGILAVPEVDADLEAFLRRQRQCFAEADWTALPWKGEHRKTELPTLLLSPADARSARAPGKDMIPVPDWNGWMTTRYRMRECGYIGGAVDALHVYDAFESTCTYSRPVRVEGVCIDPFPVTNLDFAEFLEATGYRPADARNFLRHWSGGGVPPGLEHHPVVYVGLEDARAYADWAGKRLPREEEWQAAAQGREGRIWPWGGRDLDPARCQHATTCTAPVDAFPGGRSPEGVWDLSGNVWEMTESERTDGHTRYQILKGGCWYHQEHSHWLFDTGARPGDWGAKHLLLCPAWDRCATVGFRCVADQPASGLS